MKEWNDVYTWDCECGITVTAGLSGYGDVDHISVFHCPVCTRRTSALTDKVAHKDLNRPENQLLSSSRPNTMTFDDIKAAQKAMDMASKYGMSSDGLKILADKYLKSSFETLKDMDYAEREARVTAMNMQVSPPIVIRDRGIDIDSES